MLDSGYSMSSCVYKQKGRIYALMYVSGLLLEAER